MMRPEDDPSRGVYGISTAADLSVPACRTCASMSTRGWSAPDRTAGGTRRYSDNDLARLRRISELLAWASTSPASPWCSTLEVDNERLRAELDGPEPSGR
jgi:MerR family transcriptional regulator/heat shock protein HspR